MGSRLAGVGGFTDAARKTGVSARTVYRHQDNDGEFARHVALAIQMAAGPVELIAWERAVSGVEEQFACGGQVCTRRRYSESLLRLFLQATNPKKYGPRPGFTRKRLLAFERKRIERDIRAEMAAREKPFDQVIAQLMRRINAVRREQDEERLAAGWTRDADGNMIPPGWIRADPPEPGPTADAGRTPRDSL